MMYGPKNFESLIGTEGFSEQLLRNHFTLYQGYVNNTNNITSVLDQLRKENKTNTAAYAELKRRFGWEFNGMRLHEYYFGNLIKGGKKLGKQSELSKKIVKDFGSYEDWEKDFKASGTMRGIGWVILYYDPMEDMLFNVWVNEHDTGHLSGARPILVMDVFEHAFITDYGLKRAEYIEAFFKVLNWEEVSKRFDKRT